MSAPENRKRRPGTGAVITNQFPIRKRGSDSKKKASRQPSSTLIRAGNNFLAPRRQP
jgi:hypothetical protein